MIILCIGMQASGSTWVFNVVRSISNKYGKKSISFFCEEAKDFVDYVDIVDGFLIVKCHHVDDKFIKLLSMMDSKAIVTTRDPRDCVVSQLERFSSRIIDVAGDLSRSLSSISMLLNSIDVLPLSYENKPFDDVQTVKNIAHFMGVSLTEEDCQSIFDSMQPDVIKKNIEEFKDNIDNNLWFDPETHWHPNHVGDGATGKWEQRLPEPYRDSLTQAFMPDSTLFQWPAQEILWDANMFYYYDDRVAPLSREVVCNGNEQCLIWGPYFHLPAGHWTIEFLIEPLDPYTAPVVKIDILSSGQGQGMIELRSVNLAADERTKLSVDIENFNHLSRIEARVHSTGDGRSGRFRFNGIRIRSRGGRGLRDSGRAALVQ